MNTPQLLGVIGGLGPMATFYFCQLLTSHTKADIDNEHIDMLISSRATTPDRTAFILDNTQKNPLPVMQQEAKRLIDGGAQLLVLPCNTAHYFYDGLQRSCSVPILNIIQETVSLLTQNKIHRFGLLATEGTVQSGAYSRWCNTPDTPQCIVPSKDEQEIINTIIFDQIKRNRPVDMKAFQSVADALLKRDCECIVLGCTELSLLKQQGLDNTVYLDSLEVLAYKTILACKKTPVGFPPSFFPAEVQE